MVFFKISKVAMGGERDTFPDIHKPSEKLVVVTPINKKKIVRITTTNKEPFREPVPLEVVAQESVVTKVYTRRPKVPKTNGSNSKPKIAKSMISNKTEPGTSWGYNTSVSPSSSSFVDIRAKKNKLEDHPRNVRPSLHNKKSVVNTKAISSVPNSKLNVNSDPKCATYNGCLFFDNYDSCLLEFINSVNARVKSKSTKKPMNKKIWKPTGKVFTTIGHKWRPTRRTFTLVGNVCPLTRITTTAIVPFRKPIPIESNTSKLVVTLVCSQKSTDAKNTVPFGKYKINKSLVANKKEPNKSWGFTISNVPSSSTVECRNFWVQLNSGMIMLQRIWVMVTKRLGMLLFQRTISVLHVQWAKVRRNHTNPNLKTLIKKLYLLHMDLCGPKRVESINGKKYILFIIDDYSRFTWVKCLRSKEEALDFIIKFLKIIQVRLKVPVRQAVAIDCYTQNRSIIRLRYEKTPYELLHHKLPDLSFLHVFGALCYPTNDSENLKKLQPKADIGIFIRFAPTKKAFWIYNRRTRRIFETIHVDFDELTAMASEQSSSGPALNEIAPATITQAESTSSPSSTTIDQDAPSLSKSQTTPKIQSFVIPQDVEEDIHDIEVAHIGNDQLFSVPIPEDTSAQSSSTMDKDALTQSCLIEAMQEELNEFEQLKHMNSWMELLIRSRPENALWTVAITGTVSIRTENHRFMIETDQHIIGTLDGTTRSEGTKNLLSELIKLWTPLINNILQECGSFNETKGPHCFEFSYNDRLGVDVPQQPNFSDCGVITSSPSKEYPLALASSLLQLWVDEHTNVYLTDCVQYVADWFKKPKYQGTYSESIHFLGNMQQWKFLQNIQKAIPPRMNNPQPGRPKNTNCIQSQGEEPRVIHCSRCKQARHRRDQFNKPFVVELPVNNRTQRDHDIQNNQPSFSNPNQQYDNTFNGFNHYTSQQYNATTYLSQEYDETTYPSQPYEQYFTNTSQAYDGHHAESSQMYEQYNSQQYASQHIDDLKTNDSNNWFKSFGF
nr:transposase, MuDR, MULE transposase domain protein [Tanacetum cinerariifolium]